MTTNVADVPGDIGQSATTMAVDALRLILMLPLKASLEEHGMPLYDDHYQAVAELGNWVLEPDHLKALNLPGELAVNQKISDRDYETFLYFHPFVRSFLFPAIDGDTPRPMRLWVRDAKSTLSVTLPIGQGDGVQTVAFDVDRCHFLDFKSQGVALLVVELNAQINDKQAVTFASALDTIDFLRRAYPGYYFDKELCKIPGRYPYKFVLCDEAPDQSKQCFESPSNGENLHSAFLKTVYRRETPIDPLWAHLLGNDLCKAYEQIEDERMPHMAFLGVKDPRAISRGDWVRLAFADYHGCSGAHPYAPGFLGDFESQYCYDRWYSPVTGEDGRYGWMCTRYINVGYGFAAVGSSEKDKDGKSFFLDNIQHHFRRQYFWLALLAHFDKAALLAFSGRLSKAVVIKDSEKGDPKKGFAAYRVVTKKIFEDLLEFNHRYWFAGVSNQLQASELYHYWFKHLGLRELHDDVMQEATATHEYLNTELANQQNETITNATKLGVGFAIVSLLLAWVGILVGAMGAGFPVSSPLDTSDTKKLASWQWADYLNPFCLLDNQCHLAYPVGLWVLWAVIVVPAVLIAAYSWHRYKKLYVRG